MFNAVKIFLEEIYIYMLNLTYLQDKVKDILYVPALLTFNSILLSSVKVFGASVTNLNEPPRALATSTIMWVRS